MPKGVSEVLLFIGLTIAAKVIDKLKDIIIHDKMTMKQALFRAYGCFLGISVLIVIILAFITQALLKMDGLGKDTATILVIAHIVCFPIFLYIFIRHIDVLNENLALPPELADSDSKTKTEGSVINCCDKKKQKKKKKNTIDVDVPIFAVFIYSRVMLAMAIVIFTVGMAMSDPQAATRTAGLGMSFAIPS